MLHNHYFGDIKNSTIKNLKVYGNITSDKEGAAGIVSWAYNSILENLEMNGKIQGANNSGGIIGGSNDNLTISNCTNNADVTASKKAIGDICGTINSGNAIIRNCNNTGDISGNNWVGGICGAVRGQGGETNVRIIKSYNSGEITSQDEFVGDIVGRTVENPYTATVSIEND